MNLRDSNILMKHALFLKKYSIQISMMCSACHLIIEELNTYIQQILIGFTIRAICSKFLAKAYVLYARRGHGEHSCEIILNLDQLFRRKCHLKKKFTEGGRIDDDPG